MDWTTPIDIYCERMGHGFWAEPLNAWSNLSFIVAGALALHTARRLGVRAWDVWILIALSFLIGIGSFLFHTFANLWSSFADVVPIWTFVALFVVSAMRRIGGRSPRPGVVMVIALLAIGIVVFMAGGTGSDTDNAVAATEGNSLLNGSQQYLPALLGLLVFAILAGRRGNPMTPWIWAAAGTFALSLVLRTVDMHMCSHWHHGTHLFWHLLNGLMIGILLDGHIKLIARQSR